MKLSFFFEGKGSDELEQAKEVLGLTEPGTVMHSTGTFELKEDAFEEVNENREDLENQFPAEVEFVQEEYYDPYAIISKKRPIDGERYNKHWVWTIIFFPILLIIFFCLL